MTKSLAEVHWRVRWLDSDDKPQERVFDNGAESYEFFKDLLYGPNREVYRVPLTDLHQPAEEAADAQSP